MAIQNAQVADFPGRFASSRTARRGVALVYLLATIRVLKYIYAFNKTSIDKTLYTLQGDELVGGLAS